MPKPILQITFALCQTLCVSACAYAIQCSMSAFSRLCAKIYANFISITLCRRCCCYRLSTAATTSLIIIFYHLNLSIKLWWKFNSTPPFHVESIRLLRLLLPNRISTDEFMLYSNREGKVPIQIFIAFFWGLLKRTHSSCGFKCMSEWVNATSFRKLFSLLLCWK